MLTVDAVKSYWNRLPATDKRMIKIAAVVSLVVVVLVGIMF